MATTRKLVELFRAIAAEDFDGASAAAGQICKSEERMGHRGAARLLRGALNGYRNGAATNGLSSLHSEAKSPGIMASALFRLDSNVMLDDVFLANAVRRELDVVISEWTHRRRLSEHGILPRTKLLFHGPPGCGKSLTAQAVGRELGIPVYLVRFNAIIGAFLGQTATHLRQLFHFAETTPCILLLDELDALGKKRGNPLDVGELDRIVIALLQELEHSKPLGIIVGTSNLPEHLDRALWRRFDLDVVFRPPTVTLLRPFIKALATKRKILLPNAVTAKALRARSFAEVEAIVIAEARRQALKSVE
jgi:SpoVK/Ycf46/Vps4 family AAA+-type ATPase